MTDSTQPWLSNELWTAIASFLDEQDLARFRQVCKANQLIGTQSSLLQPLYNRLYAMDKSLPPVLPVKNEEAFAAFTKAFLKIQTRQEEEIAYLREKNPTVTSKPEYAWSLRKTQPKPFLH